MNARRIYDALIQVMQGQHGIVRLGTGTFRFRAFSGLAQAEQQSIAREQEGHVFDVTFPQIEINASSGVSGLASERHDLIQVVISIWSYAECVADEVDWLAHRAKLIDDTSSARRALHYAGALETTASGDDTAIVDGVLSSPDQLRGPVWVPVDEQREQGLIRSEIRGSLIVVVQQPAP